ncbi:Bromodomain [Macleaya cordata]|uniref:Bromodomain n=1 Tax=Macleaya cordata TaxID=56857 RepID=A0A200QIF7_MACCD|nr:Bromodomain [Macleaya cordata]
MASKPSSGGGGGGDGSRDKHKWAESKVYTRKSHTTTKVSSKNLRQQPPPSSQTLTSEDGNNSSQPPQLTRFDAASDDDSSSPNLRQLGPSNDNRDPPSMNGFSLRSENRVTINIASKLKQELRELRRKLSKELDQVRSLIKKLEAKELQFSASYTQSQLSTNYTIDNGGGGSKREKFKAPLHRLSISAIEDSQGGLTDDVHKEKRTPKANQYYRNSEFVLGKEKLPPQESNKKSKNNGGKKNGGSGEGNYGFGMDKNYGRVFKSCSELLAKLMKHKHGWVFNTPVDVKGLGLRDYYVIIKNPMDLGTVKARLNKNGYKSPKEFAEDVKLTFHNAMSYNRKGQDVHIMAEELLKIFEDKWVVMQAKFNLDSRFEGNHEVGHPNKIRKRDHFPAPETKRVLDRSESTTVPVNSQLKPLDVVASGKASVQKKPKASDLNKRDMTYDEKQRLSTNLQSLPVEKLDNIVQIIKNRNSSLCQHDDEIEVDIDSVDTETLWELDRFVTNYKKSLSKNKRKAETAIQPREESEQKVQEMDPVPPVVEVPKETETVLDGDEKNVSSSLPVQEEKKGDLASRSSSSSSSSSDSGSSSSDSDSDSSSASDSGD